MCQAVIVSDRRHFGTDIAGFALSVKEALDIRIDIFCRYVFKIFRFRIFTKPLAEPAPPLKRKVIFCRHSEKTVILSLALSHHKGESLC